MEAPRTLPPFDLNVNLGKETGTKQFTTIAELQSWFSKEQQFWTWTNTANHTNEKIQILQSYNQFIVAMANHLNEFNHRITVSLNANNPFPDVSQFLLTFRNIFQNYYDTAKGIYSESPRGQFINQLRITSGVEIAIWAYGYLTHVNNALQMRGALAAFLFENNLRDTATAERASLDILHTEWRGKFTTIEAAQNTNAANYASLNQSQNDLITEKQKEFNTAISTGRTDIDFVLAESKKKVDSQIASADTDFKNLKATLEVSMATQAPVKYWRLKANSHKLMAFRYTWFAAILILSVVGGLVAEIIYYFRPPEGIQHPETWHPQYWEFAILITSALFAIWIVRLVIRLLLSNIHLLSDARERETMVMTYLSLLRRGKIDKDREKYILNTLFRPSSTGLMKDDAVPVTIADLVSNLNKQG